MSNQAHGPQQPAASHGRGSQSEAEGRARAQDWAAANGLADALRGGWRPPPIRGSIVLRQGEMLIAQVGAQMWMFSAEDVEYEKSYTLAGGPVMSAATLLGSVAMNAKRKAQAKRQAAAQWRPLGPAELYFTTMRLGIGGNGEWHNVEYGDIQSLQGHDDGIQLASASASPLWFRMWNPRTHFVLLNYLATGRVP